MTTVQLVTETLALSTNVLTLDAALFWQIRPPAIDTDEERLTRLDRAAQHSIGYAVAPLHGAPVIWLIVLENDQLWRWAITPLEGYDAATQEYPWLAEIPQVFLVGDPRPPAEPGFMRARTRYGQEPGN